MAGLVPADVEREAVQPTYIDNLRWAAAEAAKAGRDLLIEPINTRDIPRFFLNRQDHAHEIVDLVGAPNLKVQMDLYHCQIVEGDVAMKIRKYLPTGRVGHFQIAGVPERHEPDIGELNHPYLFRVIDEVSAQCGWEGWVGCEYRPRARRGGAGQLRRAGLAARAAARLKQQRGRIRPIAPNRRLTRGDGRCEPARCVATSWRANLANRGISHNQASPFCVIPCNAEPRRSLFKRARHD